MSRVRTYFLAPNFTLTDAPGSPWHPWLGNIIADPLNPTRRVLSKLSDPPTGVCTVPELDNQYTQGQGNSINALLWANFFQVASAKVGGERSKDVSVTYNMSGMETRYFDPNDDEVTARIQVEPKIQTAMSSGLFGKKPVYMVTGIKVAKGFSLSEQHNTKVAGNVGGSAPITPEGTISAGAEIGGERRSDRSSFARAGEGVDIVFAYQVHIISEKGWREKSKRIETDVYVSKGAFLGAEKEGVDSGFEASEVLVQDLEENEDNEEEELQKIEIDVEGMDKCMCLFATT